MIEAVISAGLAIVTGVIAFNNRLNARIDRTDTKIGSVDRRIDVLELSIVRDFVQKTDLAEAINRMETHMIRIEDKLDKLPPCRTRRQNDQTEE